MAWSWLQSNSGTSGGVTSFTVAYTSNLTAGTKLTAVSGSDTQGAGNTLAVKDSHANAFTKILSKANNAGTTNGETAMWAVDTPAADAGTTQSITVTYTTGISASLLIQEVSGLATGNTLAAMIDGTAGFLTGTGQANNGPPSYTSTASNEYLLYGYGDNGPSGTSGVATGGYTADPKCLQSQTTSDCGLAYKNSTGGTEAGQYATVGNWTLILAAFKLPAAGAPDPGASQAPLPAGMFPPLSAAFGPGAPFAGVSPGDPGAAAAPVVNATAEVATALAAATGLPAGSPQITVGAGAATALAAAPDATVSTSTGTVTNNFEGGTNGTAVTTGNAGGTGNTLFDAVNLTAVAFDNTHAAHGSLAAKMTAANSAAYVRWAAALGTQSQVWFRLYLYFTALPSFSGTVWSVSNAGGLCAGLNVNTLGHLVATDSAGSATTTSTAVIPVNAWFRVEGFVTFSATVGQTEVKLFATSVDGVTADETDTSAATQNTRGAATTYSFGAGFQNSPAVYWFDDIGVSAAGYIGPVSGAVTVNAGAAAAAAVANAAVPAVVANAAPATGLAAAPQPVPAVTVNAGAAAAAAAAVAAAVSFATTASAGAAAATATANPATGATGANAAPAAALAVAPAPVAAIAAKPAPAAAVAAANQPVPVVTVNAAPAVALASAPPPVPAVTVFAGVATSLAIGNAATVSTSSAATANAGVAAALATANPAVPVAGANAAPATGLASALQPATAVTVNAGVATALVSAPAPVTAAGAKPAAATALAIATAPVTAVTVNAPAATALAIGNPATVTTSSAGTANPAPAAALASAVQPAAAIAVHADPAAALASAPPATGQASRLAPAGAATALAAAPAATFAAAAQAAAAAALAQAAPAAGHGVSAFTTGTLTAADAANTLTAGDAAATLITTGTRP